MSRDNEILMHIFDIKNSVARIETKMEDYPQTKSRITDLETEQTKMQTTVKVGKRLIYGMLVGLPSLAVAVVKVLEYLKT